MADNVYDLGDTVRLTGTFVDAAGDASDPADVRIKYRPPGGDTVTLTYSVTGITKSATGIYYADVTLTSALAVVGRWYWRAEGDSTPAAAAERSFTVRESRL